MVRGMFLSLNPTLETCEKSVATCLLRPAKGNVLSAKGNVLGERVLTACRSANGDFDGQNPEKTDLA